MKMHLGGQIKTIPVHRIHHATHETIHPLTQGDVYVHGEGLVVCSSILRRPIHGDQQTILKLFGSYWTHVLYIVLAYLLPRILSSSFHRDGKRLLLLQPPVHRRWSMLAASCIPFCRWGRKPSVYQYVKYLALKLLKIY